jgi:hypothetical protein
VTRDLNAVDGLPGVDVKVLEDVKHFGWHVMGVFPKKDETGPSWAYTIGLFHSFGHPEIALFGLPLKTCMSIVNFVGTRVKEGRKYEPGPCYDDVLDGSFRVAFREVKRQHYPEYFGFAKWFYESDPFPVLQCFWPDKEHRLPWDAGASDGLREAQPYLFE